MGDTSLCGNAWTPLSSYPVPQLSALTGPIMVHLRAGGEAGRAGPRIGLCAERRQLPALPEGPPLSGLTTTPI